jgi:HAD superfamily hydrolase (TIGR01458 family)
MEVDGVLLDMDGVLAISWEPILGAAEALAWLRDQGIPYRLITNTTTHSRSDLARTLSDSGIPVAPSEVVTAVVATAGFLHEHHPGAKVFLLTDGDPREDLEGVEIVDDGADVVVIGGASEDFDYATLNRVFRMLMEGAALIGMHRNMYWRTSDGLELDAGAYIAGLEEATGTSAIICGKPAPAFFDVALGLMAASRERAVMVGDDIVNDVLGAQAAGITGVLVRTGKFQPGDLDKGEPDHVIESIADLPELLASA